MSNAIVHGSLSAIAQHNNSSLAESFLSCDAILILDCSGSMSSSDAPGDKTRAQAAKEQLIQLQKNHPGKLALVCFADYATFTPGGLPISCGGTTNMVAALEYVFPADDTNTKFILISDGSPDDPHQTLATAKKFKTPIEVCYIGPENDLEGGRTFLYKLAHATGGRAVTSDAPGLLGEGVERLLLT